ncbi:hypothetical protein ACROYT_G011154, partial [Oculina patagonica]
WIRIRQQHSLSSWPQYFHHKMSSRFTAVFLLLLVAISMYPQTHAFTAGAGNIDTGRKRGMESAQIAFRLRRICETAEMACSSLRRKKDDSVNPLNEQVEQ